MKFDASEDYSDDADSILAVQVTRSCEDHIDSLFSKTDNHYSEEELTAPISSTYLSKRKAQPDFYCQNDVTPRKFLSPMRRNKAITVSEFSVKPFY